MFARQAESTHKRLHNDERRRVLDLSHCAYVSLFDPAAAGAASMPAAAAAEPAPAAMETKDAASSSPLPEVARGPLAGLDLTHLALSHCPRVRLQRQLPRLPFAPPRRALSLAGLASRAELESALGALARAGAGAGAVRLHTLDLSDARLSAGSLARGPGAATATDETERGAAEAIVRGGGGGNGFGEFMRAAAADAPVRARTDGYFDQGPETNDAAEQQRQRRRRERLELASLPPLALHLLWAPLAAPAPAPSRSLGLSLLDLSGCEGLRNADFSHAQFEW